MINEQANDVLNQHKGIRT